MIVLDWPWVLAALPLPVLARVLPRAPIDVGAALRFPLQFGLRMEPARGRRAPSWWRLAMATLAWMLLVLAAARPQWVGEPIALPLAGRDLMLAVDISGSMEQQDYELNGRAVSRLAAVQAVASGFIGGAIRTGSASSCSAASPISRHP